MGGATQSMMLHYTQDEECTKCSYYTRFLTDNKSWFCEVCLMNELGFEDDESGQLAFGRYQFQCGHQAHIRCLQRWCKDEGYVGCPTCGRIAEIETNQFCNACESFGHSSKSCTK